MEHKKKILVIEDEEMVRDGLIEILSNHKYDVIGAKNGEEGLELAHKFFPDLILCDIMMPGINGYQVLEALQQDDNFVTTPFIFLTAKTEREDIREGMGLGADDFITKPFKFHELINAIDARFIKEQIRKDKAESKLNDLRLSISTVLPHEFRTPLNGILGSSQLLIEYSKTMDKEELLTLYENIHTSAKRLNRLIINYLFYTELELLIRDKKRVLHFKNATIIDQPSKTISEIFKTYAKDYNREDNLVLDLQDAPIRIYADHLQKISEEFADNAFNFSKKGDLISVKTTYDSDYFFISVKDNGRGIPAEKLNDIGAYMQFNRKVQEQQGLGLGLIIAIKLAKVYNGNFNIDSKIDEYTEVTISLPLQQE